MSVSQTHINIWYENPKWNTYTHTNIQTHILIYAWLFNKMDVIEYKKKENEIKKVKNENIKNWFTT